MPEGPVATHPWRTAADRRVSTAAPAGFHRAAGGAVTAEGIAEVLTYAVGVAISPVPIIAVILMLFSSRAKANGPMFLLGWAVALAVVSGVAYVAGDAVSDSSGQSARTRLDSAKGWLAAHNDAVMAVLFLVFGVKLISEGVPPLL